jgi:hypothetical protein
MFTKQLKLSVQVDTIASRRQSSTVIQNGLEADTSAWNLPHADMAKLLFVDNEHQLH